MPVVFLAFLCILITGCSLQKLAIRSSTPLFIESGELLTRESNWDFFRASSPANLKFMELLYLQDQTNLPLLGIVIKGYAGYSYAVAETLSFEEQIIGAEPSPWKKEAIFQYTRALDYGLYYLKEKGISSSDLLNFSEEKLLQKFDQELNEQDLMPLLYTAQSWGSLINLQQDNVAMVSQVPKVKILFDWVCNKKPDIENGICDVFPAQYEASRPRMLGGSPEKAEKLYLAAIKKHPKNLLFRLNYIQYIILPSIDEEKYEVEAALLREQFSRWQNLNRDELTNKSEYEAAKSINLFNAIALKRFEIIEKNKKKIF